MGRSLSDKRHRATPTCKPSNGLNRMVCNHCLLDFPTHGRMTSRPTARLFSGGRTGPIQWETHFLSKHRTKVLLLSLLKLAQRDSPAIQRFPTMEKSSLVPIGQASSTQAVLSAGQKKPVSFTWTPCQMGKKPSSRTAFPPMAPSSSETLKRTSRIASRLQTVSISRVNPSFGTKQMVHGIYSTY